MGARGGSHGSTVWGGEGNEREGMGVGLEIKGCTLVIIPEVRGESDEVAAGPGAGQGY